VMGTAGTQASDEDEAEGLAARAVSRVKSIARGLMEKLPHDDRGSVSEEEDTAARPAKAGRVAAARGAKKGTRGAGGKSKKQSKRPMKAKSRSTARGAGKGRGGRKGARGKSGGKRRPSTRKGKK